MRINLPPKSSSSPAPPASESLPLSDIGGDGEVEAAAATTEVLVLSENDKRLVCILSLCMCVRMCVCGIFGPGLPPPPHPCTYMEPIPSRHVMYIVGGRLVQEGGRLLLIQKGSICRSPKNGDKHQAIVGLGKMQQTKKKTRRFA